MGSEGGPERHLPGRLRAAASGSTSAPWLRAPILLLRFPSLLVAIAGAALILAVTSAAAPLFVSSAGNATLENDLGQQVCPYTVGLQVASFGPIFGPAYNALTGSSIPGTTAVQQVQRQDAVLRSETAGLPGLRSPVRTIVGPSLSATAGRRDATLVAVARDGAMAHVRVLSSSGRPGVWLTDSTATRLRVKAGDRIRLGADRRGPGDVRGWVSIPVAGTYRDLAGQPPATFWCSLSGAIYPQNAFSLFHPPPLVLVDRPTMLTLGARLRIVDAQFIWEYPLAQHLSLPLAERLGGSVSSLQDELRGADPSSRFAVFNFPQVQTELPSIAQQAADTTGTVQGPVDAISIAGRVVALLVIAAAGAYWVDRRRTEVALLSARGVGPPALAVKVLLETAGPIAVGAVGGLALAGWLVRRLGPAPNLDASASVAARWQVAAGAGLAWVLLAVVAALSSRRAGDPESARGRSALASAPWEIAVLLLAAASLYEITTRGAAPVSSSTAGGPTRVDALLLLFPILFLAGTAGLAARLLRRALPRLRRAGSRRRPSVYLASRRLAGASTIALALVTATALSVGILAYAGTLSASARASARAKALVFTGSDVQAVVPRDVRMPARFPYPWTRVVNVTTASFLPGIGAVDAVGIDPASFARVAYWDPSFSARPLGSILARLPLAPRRPLPVLMTGAAPAARGTLGLLGGTNVLLPVRVVATVTAFPGMQQNRTLVACDRRALAPYASLNVTNMVLIKGPASGVLAALRAAHVRTENVVTADEVSTATPVFLSLSWIFQFLQALGVLTGLIALGGAVLYLEARQRSREVSYALARRMGLSRRAHRRSVLFELGGMLLAGLLLAWSLSWVAAKLVYGKLDPQPQLPPPALFRSPLWLLGVTTAALFLVAVVGAWLVQRAADRARVSEVLRVAG